MAFRGAVITFPGSNCDRDMAVALEKVSGVPALRVRSPGCSLPLPALSITLSSGAPPSSSSWLVAVPSVEVVDAFE